MLRKIILFILCGALLTLLGACATVEQKEPEVLPEPETMPQTDVLPEPEQTPEPEESPEPEPVAEKDVPDGYTELDGAFLFDGDSETLFEPSGAKRFAVTHAFGEPVTFNVISFGRVKYTEKLNVDSENTFTVRAFSDGKWREIYGADELTSKRDAASMTVTTEKFQLLYDTEGTVESISDIAFSTVEKVAYTEPFRSVSYLRCNSPIDWAEFDGHLDVMTDLILIDVCGGFSSDGKLLSVSNELGDYVNSTLDALGGRDVKLWFCIGNCKDISDKTLSTDEAISSLVAECRKICADYDFYGINIDYEYPSSNTQWNNYSKFIVALADALREDGRFVSAAMAPWGLGISSEAKKSLEHVDIMAYDLFDAYRRHSSYDTALDAVKKAKASGFEDRQIILGLAFYSREIDAGASERWWGYNGFVDKYEVTRSTNYADGAYFSGYYLNRDKTFLAIQNGLGGVFSWHLRCDLDFYDSLSLTAAVAEAAEEYAE